MLFFCFSCCFFPLLLLSITCKKHISNFNCEKVHTFEKVHVWRLNASIICPSSLKCKKVNLSPFNVFVPFNYNVIFKISKRNKAVHLFIKAHFFILNKILMPKVNNQTANTDNCFV